MPKVREMKTNTSAQLMIKLPQVTMIELPDNFRAMVLAESEDIRNAPPEAQPIMHESRMKEVCAFMAYNAATPVLDRSL